MNLSLTQRIDSPDKLMKTNCSPVSGQPARRAFTLIEMIGVMAVIAITAAMILPPLISQTDSLVAGQELATTQSFITALQNNIQRNHVIPSATNWVSIVATELGMNPTNVAYTVRNTPRVLLIDTNGFGKMTLPYTENSAGMPDALTNSTLPRFLIVSSLGSTLPAALTTSNNVNGYLGPTDFNNLWSAANGTVPTNGAWTGWRGKASDITVQRLNVGYLFAHLVLSNLDPTNAFFSVNGSALITLPANTASNSYYLTATVLSLYLANTNLEATQVLNNDSSWVFSGGGWRNSAAPAPGISGVNLGTNSAAAAVLSSAASAVVACSGDCRDCSRQCCAQSFCTNCVNHWTSRNPNDICNDITNYMGLYQQYVNNNCQHNSTWTALQTCCNKLNSDCGSLCQTHY